LIRLRKILLVLAVLVAAMLVLAWFLPARWVMPWVEPQLHGLHLRQVHGTVWDGTAGDVLGVDGRRLGRLQWQLSRRALLGQLQVRLSFDGPQADFSGTVRRTPQGNIEAEGWQLHADLAATEVPLPVGWGKPLGELHVAVDHVVLQGGWPLQLQAQGQWQPAAVRTADGELALGEWQGDAQAQGGVIHAQWHDQGAGPLQVRGELQLSPLGWRLDSTLRARHRDPALQRWLARLGPVAPDGSVHIRQAGGLAANSPPNHQDNTLP
jgi:general secretion pathway protein N